MTTSVKGGNIGRMPIHPLIMKYGDILFTDFWAALDQEKKTVSKMSAIELHPKSVILIPKSAVTTPVEPQPEAASVPTPLPTPGV